MKFFSLFFLFFICGVSAQAQLTLTVTRSDDRNATCNSGVDCSLREAVNAANASPSDDTINFANTVTNVTLTGEIVVNNAGALTIDGRGANLLTIDGAGAGRIFYTNGATVTISGETLRGGNGIGTSSGNGGAIYANGGSLTLAGVHVTGNSVAAGSAGGGVIFIGGTNNRIINSTFSANQAPDCAGFYNFNSGLSVANSTISGNTASNTVGGGFCNGGSSGTTLRNVTITGNSAPSGGGIYNFGGTLNFGNTIVAGNTASTGTGPEIYIQGGSVVSAGNNLVGASAGASANTGTGFAITYQTSDIRDTNPRLGGLTTANGGSTPTHALLAGSPAVDAGNNALAVDPSNNSPLTTDQRGMGFPRIVDGNNDGTPVVDIGAFEAPVLTTAANISVRGRVTDGRRGVLNAVVRMTNQNGETQTARTNFFGYYSFKDVPAGETYVFNVSSKRYQFNTQVVTILEDYVLNFSAR